MATAKDKYLNKIYKAKSEKELQRAWASAINNNDGLDRYDISEIRSARDVAADRLKQQATEVNMKTYNIGDVVQIKGEDGIVNGIVTGTRTIMATENKRTGNRYDRRCREEAMTVYIISVNGVEYRRTADRII